MARTYESALSLLSALQSNKAVTSLFSVPILPSPPASSSQGGSDKSQDLNALAIPEMLTWLGRAGLSQSDLAQLKCIHVAGTKGKGSVCAFLTSILVNSSAVAGKVGTYTSPHLVSVRERIMIDGRPLAPDLFACYFFEVWDAFTEAARAELGRKTGDWHSSHSDSFATARAQAKKEENDRLREAELQGPATKPFYFRFLTILAFHVFLREGVRSAVVECGIGGEYDSTNVLPAEAVTAGIVTQLGIDHVGMLGGTLPEIAWHKIGVAKAERKCFTRRLTGDDGEATMEVLRRRAAELGAELVEVPDEAVEAWGGVRAGDVGGLEGGFQKYNQALAVSAAREHLQILTGPEQGNASNKSKEAMDFSSLPEGFAEGLRKARLRGRCETRQEDNVTWLIDGAHTAESLQEVARWFASKRSIATNTRHVLLFNQQERDAAKLLEGLYSGIQQNAPSSSTEAVFDKAVFTRNELQRRSGDEPERDVAVQNAGAEVLLRLSPESQVVVCDNVADAVSEVSKIDATEENAKEKTIVLVTGSLHLVGALLRTLEPDAPF
ncbi:FolC bifunctional protein [Apiospora arundinis]|uniref:Folylpolyglutamate synthase n=1 Tax=Apiospora arundinis TaxID=335852 RepID=A0ABR2HRP1_9PEZI